MGTPGKSFLAMGRKVEGGGGWGWGNKMAGAKESPATQTTRDLF